MSVLRADFKAGYEIFQALCIKNFQIRFDKWIMSVYSETKQAYNN